MCDRSAIKMKRNKSCEKFFTWISIGVRQNDRIRNPTNASLIWVSSRVWPGTRARNFETSPAKHVRRTSWSAASVLNVTQDFLPDVRAVTITIPSLNVSPIMQHSVCCVLAPKIYGILCVGACASGCVRAVEVSNC